MEEQKRTFPASQDPDKFREDMARYMGLAVELGATEAKVNDRLFVIGGQAPLPCHRTNTDSKLRQTGTRVSDKSRYRRLAGRNNV